MKEDFYSVIQKQQLYALIVEVRVPIITIMLTKRRYYDGLRVVLGLYAELSPNKEWRSIGMIS
jgi:hypothetical protein